jgi:phosphohistidine phosphatase SixA
MEYINVKFIRHAKSEANIFQSPYPQNYYGFSEKYTKSDKNYNSKLSEEGKCDINNNREILLKQLNGEECEIYSSPILRACETANLIFKDKKINIIHEISEYKDKPENYYDINYDINYDNNEIIFTDKMKKEYVEYINLDNFNYNNIKNKKNLELLEKNKKKYICQLNGEIRKKMFHDFMQTITSKNIIMVSHYDIIKLITEKTPLDNLGIVSFDYNKENRTIVNVKVLPLYKMYNNKIINLLSNKDEIKLLTINLSWEAMSDTKIPILGILGPSSVCKSNIAYAIDFMKNYDFVAFQEAYNWKDIQDNSILKNYEYINIKSKIKNTKNSAELVLFNDKEKYKIIKYAHMDTLEIFNNEKLISINNEIEIEGSSPALLVLYENKQTNKKILVLNVQLEHISGIINLLYDKKNNEFSEIYFNSFYKNIIKEILSNKSDGTLNLNYELYIDFIISTLAEAIKIDYTDINIDIYILGDFNLNFEKFADSPIKLKNRNIYFIKYVNTCCDDGIKYVTQNFKGEHIWKENTNGYTHKMQYDNIMSSNKIDILTINPCPFPASDHHPLLGIFQENKIIQGGYSEYLKNEVKKLFSQKNNSEILKSLDKFKDIDFDSENYAEKCMERIELTSDHINILKTIFPTIIIPKNNIFFTAQEIRGNSISDEFDINKKQHGAKYTTSFYEDIKKNKKYKDIIKKYTHKRNNGDLLNISLSNDFICGKDNDGKRVISCYKTIRDLNFLDLGYTNFSGRILFRRLLAKFILGADFEFLEEYETTDTQNTMFYNLAFSCEEIDKKYADCISGYWDGRATINEKIINYYIDLFNDKIETNELMLDGVISIDKVYSEKLQKNMVGTEYIFLSSQHSITISSVYFKGQMYYNPTDIKQVLDTNETYKCDEKYTEKDIENIKAGLEKFYISNNSNETNNIDNQLVISENGIKMNIGGNKKKYKLIKNFT